MGAMIVAGHSMCTDSTLNEIVRAQPPFGHFGRVIYVVNANDVGIAPPRKKTLYLSLIDCEIVAGDTTSNKHYCWRPPAAPACSRATISVTLMAARMRVTLCQGRNNLRAVWHHPGPRNGADAAHAGCQLSVCGQGAHISMRHGAASYTCNLIELQNCAVSLIRTFATFNRLTVGVASSSKAWSHHGDHPRMR
jgi:hypothetical protein